MTDHRLQTDGGARAAAVRVRREAFEGLDRTPGFDAWPQPASVDAPPVGPRGVPEVDVDDLDAEVLRASILAHGCLLVRRLVAAGEVERLVAHIDRAFADRERYRIAEKAGDPQPTDWYTPFRVPGNRGWAAGRMWVESGGGVLGSDSPAALTDLFETYETRGVRDVVAGYLGERPVLSATKCTLRRVPPDSDSHWHQDGAFLGAGLRVLNIWLTLTRCGRDALGLDVVPRRLESIVTNGTGDARFSFMVGTDVIEAESAETPVVRPEFEPGEALLFDELFLHSTAADPAMPRSRYAIESWFFAPSAYPDPDDQVPLVW